MYDLCDFDVRYMGLKAQKSSQKESGAAKCLVNFGVEPGSGTSDVENWFLEEV